MMSRELQFNGQTLARAIQATFQCRRSEFPQAAPTAFTEEFAENPDKGTQWNAYLSRNRLDAGGMVLAQIIQEIRLFLVKPMSAAADGQEFEETWPAGGPWLARSDTDLILAQRDDAL
jgi:hypothetical protein